MISKSRTLIFSIVITLFGLQALAVVPAPNAKPGDAGESPTPNVASGSQFKNLDCSHLVHSIYESVGLHYQYTTSRVLYHGTGPFRRVLHPSAGDLIAWRGHVGIVVDPSRHVFLSALKTGVKVSSYVSGYWRNRGNARFLRYATRDESPQTLARVEETASVGLTAVGSE